MAKKKKAKGRPDKGGNATTGTAAAMPSAPAGAEPAASSGLDSATRLAIVAGLCVIGGLLAAFLTFNKLTDTSAAFCGTGGGCDLVQHSHWSTLFGVPTAFWGLLTYLAIGAAAWMARTRVRWWSTALFVAFVGVAISIYLTIVAWVELDATCPYCMVSLGLMIATFMLLIWAKPNHQETRTFDLKVWFPSSGLAIACLIGLLHLHWAGIFNPSSGPESDDLRGIAQHLSDSGVIFYGASWCSACQRQKELFASSAHRLPFVECTPNGRGTPLSSECRGAGVEQFPTWKVGKRTYVGVQSPERLASLSGYKPAN